MTSLQKKLLCSAAIPIVLGLGIAVFAPGAGLIGTAQAQSANPCSPGGAAPSGGTNCVVPRLQQAQANPCAAKNPCAANPSAAAANPCNPCAVKNPCAAKAPCGANPCAATANPCNPSTVKKVPSGAAANPCAAQNPCAATNPCGAAAKPCNPCAVKPVPGGAAANPCAAKNPCAANPCNPCNPCGAAVVPDVTSDELRAVYDCLKDHMRTAFGDGWQDQRNFADAGMLPPLHIAYSDSGLSESKSFVDWKNFANAPYVSSTHGERFVVNHANNAAEEPYGKYEEIGTMPRGGIIAKPSFTISANGNAELGPLFVMEKMDAGWHPSSKDWRYTMVMPDGTVAGRTHGPKAEAVEFCVGCHAEVADEQDSLFFIPDEFRVK
jgi:hypothetical protein